MKIISSMPSVSAANPPPSAPKKPSGLNQDASIGVAVSGRFGPARAISATTTRTPSARYWMPHEHVLQPVGDLNAAVRNPGHNCDEHDPQQRHPKRVFRE